MPGVQFQLQAIALGEQRTVLRREVVDQGIEAGPEGGAVDPAAGQNFVVDEALQVGGDLQAIEGYAFGHVRSLCCSGNGWSLFIFVAWPGEAVLVSWPTRS